MACGSVDGLWKCGWLVKRCCLEEERQGERSVERESERAIPALKYNQISQGSLL